MGPLLDIRANGQITQFEPRPGFYEPVGTTDSEALSCDLMNAIRSSLDRDVDLQTLTQFLVKHSDAYSKLGVFNLLRSNGDWLFTYCTTKMAAITRRSPFGPARLQDADLTVDFGTVTTPSDVVSVIVTEPLTVDERWERYEPHEWRIWRKGEVIDRGKADN